MWIEETGTSADPADTNIVCDCGGRLSLQDTFQPGRLGKCRGDRPWLLDRDPDGCGDNLKLLTRTATNTYFPQVYTVISLPSEEDELTRLVHDLSGDLGVVQSVADVAQAERFNPKVSATLSSYADEEIFERLRRIRDGAMVDGNRSPKLSEIRCFRKRTPGNRPESSLCEALRANASPRCLGGPRRRTGPLGNQEPRGRPSAKGGLLPLWLHALRGCSYRRGWRDRGCSPGRSWSADFP